MPRYRRSDGTRTPRGDWTVDEEFTVFVVADNIVGALDRLGRVDAEFAIISEPGLLQN